MNKWLVNEPRRWPFNRWPYNEMAKNILVEPVITKDGSQPRDYKFFVFDGKVEFVQVDVDRASNHKRSLQNREWRHLPFTLKYPSAGMIDPPLALEQMIAGAETLGREFSFVRVDLYDIEGEPRFGELTFFPGSGLERFSPDSFDYEFGTKWPARG